MTPARVPSFDEVEPDVKTGWIEDQRAQIRQRAFEAMRARYQVVMPKDSNAEGVAPPLAQAPAVVAVAPE